MTEFASVPTSSAFGPLPPVADARFTHVRSVIVKVITRCNLDCAYCFEHITRSPDMELSTFRHLARLVFSNSTNEHVRFIFHGGEPTLLPDDWFEDAINYARQVAFLHGKQVSFTVQSNLIRVRESLLDLLRRLNVGLGGSIDGPAHLPKAMRGRAAEAIATFKHATQMGLQCGVLVTINHSNWNYMNSVMRWLEADLGIRTVKTNVMAPVGAGYDIAPLTPEQIFESHRAIIEFMLAANGQGVLEERNLREILRFVDRETRDLHSIDGFLCCSRRCGAGTSVIAVTPAGELLPCDRLQWDEADYFLGNIATHEDVADYSARVEAFHKLTPEAWIDCPTCPAAHVCSYGCQAYIARAKQRINLECVPTKMKYDYFVRNAGRLIAFRDALLLAGRLAEIEQVQNQNRDWGDDGTGT